MALNDGWRTWGAWRSWDVRRSHVELGTCIAGERSKRVNIGKQCKGPMN